MEQFKIGKKFDAVSFGLSPELLEGCDSETLIDAIVFGCGNREIKRVIVNGDEKFIQ